MSKSPITVFCEESYHKNISKKHVTVWGFLNVTHTSLLHLVFHGIIDPVDQPGEGLSIDGFSQGISGIDGMINCEWTEDL